jgi:hypothetical protein
MSWIFGCLSENLSEDDLLNLRAVHSDLIQFFKTNSLYLAIGGNNNTTFTSKDLKQINSDSQGWVVSGVGLISEESNHKIMSSKDWANRLESGSFDPSKINGHFIVIIWDNDKSIRIYNDLIGFRTIYLFKQNNRIIFSTEFAWLTKLIKNPAINLKAFGSRWLTFNQLSHECLINGIEKLAPDGKLEIGINKIIRKSNNWIPRKVDAASESFTKCLTPFLFPKSEYDSQISLGLSGGLDSRTLLALILSEKNRKVKKNVTVHSFGEKNDHDLVVAGEICKKIGVEHTLLSAELMYNERFISRLSDYSNDTLLIEPVSSFIKNACFDDDYFTNKIVIDGANGEIARRQFYNRLYLKGKLDLKNRNTKNILRHLRISRADIFNPEAMKEMDDGCLDDVRNLFEVIPDIEIIGIEKFIDLIAIKFRFPNYFGPEQSRLDKKIISYMPFSQTSVLDRVFYLPSSLKKNSRLFYKLIEENKPILKNFPLVKNGITYPYGLSSLSAFIYTKIKRRIAETSAIDPTSIFYQSIKDYVNEIFLSVEVQNFSLYDHVKIKKMVDTYYKGDKSVQSKLDWWFTFELWRRNLHVC